MAKLAFEIGLFCRYEDGESYPTYIYAVEEPTKHYADLVYLHVVEPRGIGADDRKVREGEVRAQTAIRPSDSFLIEPSVEQFYPRNMAMAASSLRDRWRYDRERQFTKTWPHPGATSCP